MALDDTTKRADAGKHKGRFTYNKVNDLIPPDGHSREDLDDLLTTPGTQGIDVLEWDVDIAKRIERGHLRTLKALSRSPLVIRQILAIGETFEARHRLDQGDVSYW